MEAKGGIEAMLDDRERPIEISGGAVQNVSKGFKKRILQFHGS